MTVYSELWAEVWAAFAGIYQSVEVVAMRWGVSLLVVCWRVWHDCCELTVADWKKRLCGAVLTEVHWIFFDLEFERKSRVLKGWIYGGCLRRFLGEELL